MAFDRARIREHILVYRFGERSEYRIECPRPKCIHSLSATLALAERWYGLGACHPGIPEENEAYIDFVTWDPPASILKLNTLQADPVPNQPNNVTTVDEVRYYYYTGQYITGTDFADMDNDIVRAWARTVTYYGTNRAGTADYAWTPHQVTIRTVV